MPQLFGGRLPPSARPLSHGALWGFFWLDGGPPPGFSGTDSLTRVPHRQGELSSIRIFQPQEGLGAAGFFLSLAARTSMAARPMTMPAYNPTWVHQTCRNRPTLSMSSIMSSFSWNRAGIPLGKNQRHGHAAENRSRDRHPEHGKQPRKLERRIRGFPPAAIQANGASNDSGGESNPQPEQPRLDSQIRAFLQPFAQGEILRRNRRGDPIIGKSEPGPQPRP